DQSFPLCIILADEETHPWFYESYVQVYSLHLLREKADGISRIVARDGSGGGAVETIALHFFTRPAKEWLKQCRPKDFSGSDPEDIFDFAVRTLNAGCYLRVELNEFHLPCKQAFGKYNFVHPNLVYGYNHDAGRFLGIGFDQYGFFAKQTFGYDDFARAYASAREITERNWSEKPLVLLFKNVPPRDPYPFSVERFLAELRGYLDSRMDSRQSYPLLDELPPQARERQMVKFGFEVYDHFELGVTHLLAGRKTMTYNAAHLLYEHKRALADAFKFVVSEYKLGGRVVDLLHEFEKVAHRFHVARSKFLRYDFTKKVGLIAEARDIVAAAKGEERQLLLRLHDQIQQDCKGAASER
ncbi:MAG TPA: hypothetical protein VFS10_15465, partial [Pyrinomonadaceae bacterium]|nr:hypothetical protein [Pyrinomonadaceae bacterium]